MFAVCWSSTIPDPTSYAYTHLRRLVALAHVQKKRNHNETWLFLQSSGATSFSCRFVQFCRHHFIVCYSCPVIASLYGCSSLLILYKFSVLTLAKVTWKLRTVEMLILITWNLMTIFNNQAHQIKGDGTTITAISKVLTSFSNSNISSRASSARSLSRSARKPLSPLTELLTMPNVPPTLNIQSKRKLIDHVFLPVMLVLLWLSWWTKSREKEMEEEEAA